MNIHNTDYRSCLLQVSSVVILLLGFFFSSLICEDVQAKNSQQISYNGSLNENESVQQQDLSGYYVYVYPDNDNDINQMSMVSINAKNVLLINLLHQLAKKLKVDISINTSNIKDKKISYRVQNGNIYEVLNDLLQDTGVEAIVSQDRKVLIIQENDEYESKLVEDFQETISGQITDAQTGEPLPGVNIIVEGSTVGTSTDLDGNFELDVANLQGTLVITSIGFVRQEVPINGRTEINIELQSDVQQLDDLVVIGYGTQQRSDLTGSISSVTQEEITATATANVMEALRGRAPGVEVKQNTGHPGSAISVRIRGTNSLEGNNEPLYVVDGFPVNDASVINNSSIESIEILKDASATAIYGSRGANGVVLITTNQANEGPTQVNIESSIGFQDIVKEMEFMNPFQWGTFMNKWRENDGESPRFSQSELSEFAAMGEGTDWYESTILDSAAPVQNHSMNVSWGSESTRISVTGSMFEQEGIIRNSGFNRIALTSNIVHEINSQLTVDLNVNFSKNFQERKLSQKGRSGEGMINAAYQLPPIYPVFDDDGSFFEPLAVPGSRLDFNNFNPLNFVEERSNELKENNILINGSLSYEIMDGLVLKASGGIEDRGIRIDEFQTTDFFRDPLGRASVSQANFTSVLSENTITYTNSFGIHDVSAVGGFTYQENLETTIGVSGNTFLSNIPETHDIATASNFDNPNTGYIRSAILSGLGRVNYTYDSRYLLTATLRADGASVFAPGEKWGYFPSFAFSWRLSEEDFFNFDDTIINNLKFRISWGKVGSQAIGPYSTLNRLEAGSTVFGTSTVTTMAPGDRLASSLKWETTEQWNIGLEIGLFDGRFDFTAEYYDKVTRDLLNPVELPRSTGYSNSVRNIGKIGNKGVELGLSAFLYDSQNLSWNIDANVAFNRSKVLALNEGLDILAGELRMISFSSFANTYREGEPLGIFIGFEEDGYDENGRLQYKEGMTKIGDPNPDMIFGLNTSVAYKNFSLSAFFQGSLGNDLINMGMIAWTIENRFDLNLLEDVYENSWTPENTDAKYPAPSSQHDIRFSDRWIFDGSYIKLRNIELAYNLPITWARNVEVYASGQNLITITDYPGLDPDVNIDGGPRSLAQGLDWSGYPQSKSITLGARLGF